MHVDDRVIAGLPVGPGRALHRKRIGQPDEVTGAAMPAEAVEVRNGLHRGRTGRHELGWLRLDVGASLACIGSAMHGPWPPSPLGPCDALHGGWLGRWQVERSRRRLLLRLGKLGTDAVNRLNEARRER